MTVVNHGLTGMRRPTVISATVLAALVLAGCAAHPAPVQGSAPAGPSSAASSIAPGQVQITGAVRQPGLWTSAQFADLPSQTVAVSFGTEHGSQSHTETGVALSAVLDRVGLVAVPGKKHSELSVGVLAVGVDGYQALVSYGELAPAFGNRAVLLATSQDGEPLARPRLVVPGDGNGGRYVNDVMELHVVNASPTS